MERAWDMGIKKLEVQTESFCAVTLFAQLTTSDHQHATIVATYKRLF
ncbi:hypothetical protein LINPERPRIM_LOCUS15320 [Linum perenne]